MYINSNEYGNSLIGDEEINLLGKVLSSKQLFRYSTDDSFSAKCEKLIEKKLNVKYAVLTVNGTAGLRAALFALDVKKDDYVLINAYTFIATASAVISMGAIPIPIDFDDKYNLNLEQLKVAIKEFQPKVIIPVHWPGLCFDLSEIIKLSLKHNIKLIEDACQSFGARTSDKYSGTWADLGVFSFQQHKQISSGEGGCIISNNAKLIQRIKRFIDHGAERTSSGKPYWSRDYEYHGENLRMNEMQSAVIYPQLKKLEKIILNQKSNKAFLSSVFRKCKVFEFLENKDDTGMNYRILTNNATLAKKIIHAASKNKILLKPLWRMSVDKYPIFKQKGFFKYTRANELAKKMIILPIPPHLTSHDLITMERAIQETFIYGREKK